MITHEIFRVLLRTNLRWAEDEEKKNKEVSAEICTTLAENSTSSHDLRPRQQEFQIFLVDLGGRQEEGEKSPFFAPRGKENAS